MTRPETGQQRSPEELREDLDVLRRDVGDTVEELADRADVPARIKAVREEKSEQVKQQVQRARTVVAEKAPIVRESPLTRPAAIGAVVLLVLGLLLRRRRNRLK